jgi:hypothetical protein
MEEMAQLATAMMVVVFAAVLLVAGQRFIEYRSLNSFDIPAVAVVILGERKSDRREVVEAAAYARRWLLHAMTLEYFLTSSAQLCSVL